MIKIFKIYFLVYIVSLTSNYGYTQNNDTLVPDLSMRISPSWFHNDIYLNKLSSVYGKTNSLKTNTNPTISVKRINFTWGLNSYHHNFDGGVVDYTSLTKNDSLVSRVSSFSLGYTVLQKKSLFIQPVLEYSGRKFNLYSSDQEAVSFSSSTIGTGVDFGYAILSSRFNRVLGDYNKLFLEIGVGFQLRYYYSERYPIYEEKINNHVVFYSFNIYASVGLWDVFKKGRN